MQRARPCYNSGIMDLPVIKNLAALGTTPLRADALRILEAGYEAVLTDKVIRGEITLDGDNICIKDMTVCLPDFERVFFVGIGKCAVDASAAFEELLGDRLTDGVVLDVKAGVFQKIRSYIGTHPFPSPVNVSATQEIVKMLTGMTERDLVFVVVSGGGSSLLCLPFDTTCDVLREITTALWRGGATIAEVNTVRKHLSEVQGGQLAKIAYPATVVSFIFSDVPGNDIGMIASGPTVMDTTTVEDAQSILAKYGVLQVCRLPDCKLNETPKDLKYFARVTNVLLVTNEKALDAMAAEATVLGYRAEVRDTKLEGYASEVGTRFADESAKMHEKTCYLWGGETTVKLGANAGIGGRSQELALAALRTLPPGRVLIAAASDGWDNTDVAGAIADAVVSEHAQTLGIVAAEALATNDSYHFWEKAGGQIVTGRTGINVADFVILLSA